MTDSNDRRESEAEAAPTRAEAKSSRPWYRKKRVLIPAAIVLLALIGNALPEEEPQMAADVAQQQAALADPTEAPNSPPATEPTEEPPAMPSTSAVPAEEPGEAGIGSPARDGSFEFTVERFRCGATEVGDEPFTETAQGHYCMLRVHVENIGQEAQSLFADNQYLLNAEGVEYSADGQATFANNPGGDELFSEINPGNAVNGVIVFDVPKKARITRARLHDSLFSGGVEVDLD